MNRRHFLQHTTEFASLALVSNLYAQQETIKKKGKRLIVLWMSGGPSHMDLWDLKTGESTGGDFKQIKTSANGVQISEVLPTVAEQFKHLVAIRSLVTNEGSHERGTFLMNTAKQPNPVVQYPAMGAVVSSLIGSKELALPNFIGIGGTAQRIGPGFLGAMYTPFVVQNPGVPPENIKPPSEIGNEEERLRRRQRLFYGIEDEFAAKIMPHVKGAKDRESLGNVAQSHASIYGKAFDLTISPLRTVFEIKNESQATIDAYGGRMNQFGMGCLLARKLIEKGVSCVQVDLGGWDNHNNIFSTIRNGNGPRLDKGFGNLVKELNDIGLWKDTVVLWMGEFGRTPKINQNGGRDHWARCWSIVVGGGSIKGGQAYGSTSKDGLDIKDKPCSIGDVYATVYKALDMDLSAQIRDNIGRPMAIAEGKPLDIF
jgi:hypothetical protein